MNVVAKLETAIVKGTETTEFKTTIERLYLSPINYSSKKMDETLKERWVAMEKDFKEYDLIESRLLCRNDLGG